MPIFADILARLSANDARLDRVINDAGGYETKYSETKRTWLDWLAERDALEATINQLVADTEAIFAAVALNGAVIKQTKADLVAALVVGDVGKIGVAGSDESNNGWRTQYNIISDGVGGAELDEGSQRTVDPDELAARLASSDADKGSAIVAGVLRAVTPEMFGAEGAGGEDDAAAINLADLAAAARGVPLLLTGVYRVASQVQQSSGVTWLFSGGRIIRDWTSTNSDKKVSATLCSRDADLLNSFYVDPGPYTPVNVADGCRLVGRGSIELSAAARAFADGDVNARMTQLYYVCHNLFIDSGIRIQCGGRDWAVTVWGDHFVGGAFEIYDGEYVYEDGFHVIGGHHGRLFGPKIASGDDCLSFNTNFNQAMSDWVVEAPVLFSKRAFAVKVANYRLGATAGFGPTTEIIEDIYVNSPVWKQDGRTSRMGYVRFDTDVEDVGLVRNCEVRDGRFMGENAGLPSGETSGVASISWTGTTDCKVLRTVARNPAAWGALMDTNALRPVCDVEFPDAPNWDGGTDLRTIDIRAGVDTPVVNGSAKCGTRGAIICDNSTGVFSDDLTITNIPTGFNAVDCNNATPLFSAGNLSLSGASGAADARGISGVAATAVRIKSLRVSNVNRPLSNPTTVARLDVGYAQGTETQRTINAGGFTVFGDGPISVLPEGGVSDTLVTINGGRRGQRIVLRNGNALPGTNTLTVTSAGNIAVGGSRLLDAADARLYLIYDGTNWQEERFI